MPGIPITSLTNFPTLLNDTLFHVVDPNEAIPDDRNKNINWLQLQALIGGGGNAFSETISTTGAVPGLVNPGVDDTIALGFDLTTTDGSDFINIGGTNSVILGDSAISIGFDNFYDGFFFTGNSVQVGFRLDNQQGVDETVQIGNDITTNAANRTVAIGHSITVNNNADQAIGIGDTVSFTVGSVNSIAIGNVAVIDGQFSIAFGDGAAANADTAIAIGQGATVSANNAVQIGTGTNTTASTLQFLGNTIADASGVVGGGDPYVEINSADTLPTATGTNSVAIGPGSDAAGQDSIAIGRAADTGAVLGAIAIGSNIVVSSANNIRIGQNGNIAAAAANSVCIGEGGSIALDSFSCTTLGHDATIGNGSERSTAIGYNASIGSNTEDAIQLGNGTNITDSTLQFLTNTLANSTSLQATTQATGVAPTSTPADGTIIVDENGTGTLWVRVAGVWRSTALA